MAPIMKRPRTHIDAVPRHHSRRQVLALLAGGGSIAVAGCAELIRSSAEQEPTASERTFTPQPTTSSATESTPTASPGTESTPPPPEETPGYKENHWHGRLFLEIDGRLVDFDQPEYYLDNIDREDAVHFHFHETGHGPNEWSNELEVVTFDRALNLLPGISYERGADGGHVLTVDGETYRSRTAGTSITVSEGTSEIDPARHWVRHGDVFWVRVNTEAPGQQPPADHAGARVGTLLVDVNNMRIDASSRRAVTPNAGSERLHFHDDGLPYRWYNEGETATLEELVNVLPGVEYRVEGDGQVLTVEDRGEYSGTYRSGEEGTTFTSRQRTTDVSPSTYELANGDVLWVYVHTDRAPENEH